MEKKICIYIYIYVAIKPFFWGSSMVLKAICRKLAAKGATQLAPQDQLPESEALE